jgi:HlyD family secretion protein
MKHRKLVGVILLVLLLVGAVAVAGVLAFGGEQTSGETSAQADASARATPAQADASAASGKAERAVIAKGIVAPVQHAALSMAASGIASEVLVQEGDRVEAGQVILRLNNQRQQAALAEAEAALASAQAQLDTLNAGPREQQVQAAQATLDAAKARLARLQEGARPDEVAAAKASLAASQAALKRLYEGADANTRIAVQAELANAEAAVHNAQAAYDKVAGDPNVGMMPQSLQLQQATNAYNAAKARADELTAPPDADKVAQANAQIKQAQANLDKMQNPATAAELAEAQAMVDQAQAQLDLLKAGARKQEIAAAEAAVAQAQAGRDQAAVALADTELRAPFAGTVAVLSVRQGEQVAAGLSVVEIGDLSSWQVETDDLSELDIVRVQEGQPVRVTFDAIPGLEPTGTVVRVQPKGEKKLGDMTYTVTVRLDNPDPRLRWNMTAVIDLP